MEMRHILTIYENYLLIFLCWIMTTDIQAQWNPDAGYIPSLTKGKVVFPSSGTNATQIIDENTNTNWTSDAPLPQSYVSRSDQNSFYAQGITLCTYSAIGDVNMVTDGSLVNSTNLTTDMSGNAWLKFNFSTPIELILSSIKLQVNDDVEIYVQTTTSTSLIGTYNSSENYSTKRFDINLTDITSIELRSTASFGVFEVAGLETNPKEFCVVDLGSIEEIGHIHTKHWAGTNAASAAAIYLSMDNINWTKIADINPETIGTVVNEVNPVQNARYIKVEFDVIPNDWNKVFLFEVGAYDRYNNFGPMPTAMPSNHTLEEMMGINGIWGWGHNQYSNLLAAGEGPDLYNAFSTHARNYHSMSWDVLDPDNAPDYVTMAAGGGTEAQWWLNWDQEYQAWVDAGLQVQSSIFIKDFDGMWDTPYASAYTFGYNYAEHFGPTNGTGHITAIEVGNEPWFYDTLTYNAILRGMAQGAKDADPGMEVFSCALQAHDPSAELPSAFFHNYMGHRIKEDMAPYLDGINVHNYSYEILDDGNATRIAVHPEHYESGMKEILNEMRFRDANLPGKKVYVSEWGWDFPGPNSDCTHTECVSEQAAAVYTVRGALFYFRLGVDRITWFFYGDDEDGGGASSLYTRSGAAESNDFGFTKKTSFYAFEAMRNLIGDRYFLGAVQEDDQAIIYSFGNAAGDITHYIGWRPISGDDLTTQSVSFVTSNMEPVTATQIRGLNTMGTPSTLPGFDPNTSTITFDASTVPLVMEVSEFLPVELTNFEGRCNHGKAVLQWSTASEENNSHFEVERKPIGTNTEWEFLDKMEGYGTTANAQVYSFIDNVPYRDNIYRLKQVDFDGQYEYSNSITVSNCWDVNVSVFPNPTQDYIQINYPAISEGSAKIKLYNTLGKKILEQNEDIIVGENSFRINFPHLVKGVYNLEIQSEGNLTKKSIVIQ